MRCHNTSKIISCFNFRGLWDCFGHCCQWALLWQWPVCDQGNTEPGMQACGLGIEEAKGCPEHQVTLWGFILCPGRGCAPYPVDLQNSYSNYIAVRRVFLQSPSWPLHSHTSPSKPSILFSNWWPICPFFLHLPSSQQNIPIFTLGFQCKCWQYGHPL